jgi:hypothetical protein
MNRQWSQSWLTSTGGLPLTEEEAGQLLKGVTRNREMAQTVRKVIEAPVEPAPVFDALSAASRKE